MKPSRVCLVLFLVASPLAAQVTAAGHASIRGRVTAADGRALGGARIIRFGTADTVRAGADGRYAIENLAVGHHLFVVRFPGFQPIEMDVTFTSDTAITVDVPLEPAVMASREKLDRVGFTSRQRQAIAGGTHEGATLLGPDELAEKGATRTSQLLEGVPDVTLRLENQIYVAYGFDGRCVMNVWLEGNKLDNVFPPSTGGRVPFSTGRVGRGSTGSASGTYSGLDNLIAPGEIGAIEIYPRPSRVPPQFQRVATQQATGRAFETRTTECGAIIIWTTQ